ncbi:MAG: hypothetical protein JWN67_5337 [Actinomycetia bacterium]|nr:hypothetical protein [Actinomycetes bacterium]
MSKQPAALESRDSRPSDTRAMSRDTVHRCLGTSFTFFGRGWLSRLGSSCRSRRSRPLVVTMRMCRSWTRSRTRLAGVSAADADVMQAAVVAQGDLAVAVDLVVADPELPHE